MSRLILSAIILSVLAFATVHLAATAFDGLDLHSDPEGEAAIQRILVKMGKDKHTTPETEKIVLEIIARDSKP